MLSQQLFSGCFLPHLPVRALVPQPISIFLSPSLTPPPRCHSSLAAILKHLLPHLPRNRKAQTPHSCFITERLWTKVPHWPSSLSICKSSHKKCYSVEMARGVCEITGGNVTPSRCSIKKRYMSVNEWSSQSRVKGYRGFKSARGEKCKHTALSQQHVGFALGTITSGISEDKGQREIYTVCTLADLLCFTAPANSLAWENLLLVSMGFTVSFFSTSLFSAEIPTLLRLLWVTS